MPPVFIHQKHCTSPLSSPPSSSSPPLLPPHLSSIILGTMQKDEGDGRRGRGRWYGRTIMQSDWWGDGLTGHKKWKITTQTKVLLIGNRQGNGRYNRIKISGICKQGVREKRIHQQKGGQEGGDERSKKECSWMRKNDTRTDVINIPYPKIYTDNQ